MQFLLLGYIFVLNRCFGKSHPETGAGKLTANLRGPVFSWGQLYMFWLRICPTKGGDHEAEVQKRRHPCHQDPLSYQEG